METEYFYHRDAQNRPIVTGCMLKDGVRTAIGRAICSRLDNPSKKIGRAIAKGRATRAMLREENGHEVVREEALSQIGTTDANSFDCYFYKSVYVAPPDK